MCIYSCHSPDVAFDHCLPLRQVAPFPPNPTPFLGTAGLQMCHSTPPFQLSFSPEKKATCFLPIKPASLVAQMVTNLPAMQETQVSSLGQEDPLEKGMATHSSILAWRIPWTEEPGGLQSMDSQSQTGLKQVGMHACVYPPTSN